MRIKWSAQPPQKIDAKSKCSPSRKESSKLIKNSFNHPVQDPIRFLCRAISDSYIRIYIKKSVINIKLKNLQYVKR